MVQIKTKNKNKQIILMFLLEGVWLMMLHTALHSIDIYTAFKFEANGCEDIHRKN